MNTRGLQAMIVAIGATGAVISWGWGGSGSNPPGWMGLFLVCFFALLPAFVTRERPSTPLVGLFLSTTWLSAIAMVTGPQAARTASGRSAEVVPLMHLLGDGSVTDDPQLWSTLAIVCVVVSMVTGIAVWAVVILRNKRSVGAAIESVGWIDVYGVDKSAPRDLPARDIGTSSLYDPTLGGPAPGVHPGPSDADDPDDSPPTDHG